MNILDITLKELEVFLEENNFKKFRAKQILHWVYKKGVFTFDEMLNLPNDLQKFLNEKSVVIPLKQIEQKISKDGTVKWLFEVVTDKGKEAIETVYIPEDERGTLCISSQVGCTLNCKFCHTGTMMWKKNLLPSEIIGQVLYAKKYLEDFNGEQKKLTNIVFMGMGEPLLNYDNVVTTCRSLIDKVGLDFSWKKITISTSGIAPKIRQMIDDVRTGLAISFHAPTDELRTEIMPINKKYPIDNLLSACKDYIEATGQVVTLEYVMLDGVNDHQSHAYKLAELVSTYKTKVNLIPFNPWPGTIYKKSPSATIRNFAKILQNRGVETTIRKTRGEDILAACGQLANTTTLT